MSNQKIKASLGRSLQLVARSIEATRYINHQRNKSWRLVASELSEFIMVAKASPDCSHSSAPPSFLTLKWRSGKKCRFPCRNLREEGTLQGLRKSGLRDILVDLFAKFVFFCLVFDVVLDSRTVTLALCPASQTDMRRMCLQVVDVVPWKPKFCFRHLTRVLSHNFWEEVRKLAIPIRLVCSHLEVIMQVRKPTRWAKYLGKICLWKRSKRT